MPIDKDLEDEKDDEKEEKKDPNDDDNNNDNNKKSQDENKKHGKPKEKEKEKERKTFEQPPIPGVEDVLAAEPKFKRDDIKNMLLSNDKTKLNNSRNLKEKDKFDSEFSQVITPRQQVNFTNTLPQISN